MLVLSRKKGQTLVLAGGIEIHVLGIAGDTVKIGVVAPLNIQVLRGELFHELARNNAAAAAATVDLSAVDRTLEMGASRRRMGVHKAGTEGAQIP